MISNKILTAVCLVILMFVVNCQNGQANEQLARVVPLLNQGFEDGLKHWAIPPAFETQVFEETAGAHSGKKAVKIDAIEKNNKPYIVAQARDLEGGALYQFSVWARTAPGSKPITAAIKMESYSAGANNGGWYKYAELPADGSWQEVSIQKRVPTDTTHCQLLLRAFSQGAVIYDDATFTLLEHGPDISVLSPTELVVDPGLKKEATYQLSLRQPWAGQEIPKVIASISPLGEDATPKSTFVIPTVVSEVRNKRHYSVTFTVPILEPKDYAVDFEYELNGQRLKTVYSAYIFTTIANRQPKFLTDNGTLLRNGKPFFPIGMYHASRDGDYRLLHESGFNAVQGTASTDIEVFKTKLDQAQQYGLAVDVPLYAGGRVRENLPNSLEKVRRFANHPAVLSWKIFDEPHMAVDGGVATEIPAVYRALKVADPNHPIELTLNSTVTQKFWGNFCDIVQPDSYPLPRFPMTQVSEMAKNAKSIMLPWQNMSFVLQSGWEKDLNNQPSVEQARCMVYLALINGAKGIWWYSMRDPGWDLTETPLWPHMKGINAEIKMLSEPLLMGEDVAIQISNSSVMASAKKYQGKLYVLVTNPTEEKIDSTITVTEGDFSGFAKKRDPGKLPGPILLQLGALESKTMVFDLP